MPAMPEMFVLGMTCLILIADLFVREHARAAAYYLSLATLLGALLLTIFAPVTAEVTFNGLFINDDLSRLLKIFIYTVTAAVFVYSRDYLSARNMFKGEFYVLGLFGVLGMMVMVSAHNLLTVYLGLELLSLSLYSMVAFDRDSAIASEAAIKYFVLGALASGMLLYGMSIVYGALGSLNIDAISTALQQPSAGNNTVLSLGLVFIVVGLAFKLGAVPFHMWLPDVYHGAPTAVTLYIGSAPEIAAFALVLRLLADGLGELHGVWRDMLIILALLSLAVGNILAIAQTNIKRMLAYSSISHVGFLLLGILAGTANGYAGAMFYIITYALMAAGAFGVVILLSRAGFEADQLDDFKGLNDRSPWFAFIMLLLLFSLAGVPPTAGFYAKLVVLKAVVDIDAAWLAAIAVVFSVIGAYYYLRVIKLMYFDKAKDSVALQPAVTMRWVLSSNGLAMLGLGLFPGALMAWCMEVLY